MKMEEKTIEQLTIADKLAQGLIGPNEAAVEIVQLASRCVSVIKFCYDAYLQYPVKPGLSLEDPDINTRLDAMLVAQVTVNDVIWCRHVESLIDNVYFFQKVFYQKTKHNVTVEFLMREMAKRAGTFENIVLKGKEQKFGKHPYSEKLFDIVIAIVNDALPTFSELYDKTQRAGLLKKYKAEYNLDMFCLKCADKLYQELGIDIESYKKAFPDLIKRPITDGVIPIVKM